MIIFRYFQKKEQTMTMEYSDGTHISSTITQASCGSQTNIWGVDASHNIWQYTGSGTTWTQIQGQLNQVSVAADGTVWGVNSGGDIFKYTGNNTWSHIPGSLAQVSVGSASIVWGVGAGTQVYQYNGSGWTQINGSRKQISVASDGTIWGAGSGGQIYRYNGDTTWTQIPTNSVEGGPNIPMTQLTIAAWNSVQALDAQGNTYQYNSDAVVPWEQQLTFPLARSLSFAATVDQSGVLIDTQGITHLFTTMSW
jgi:virginiamycin B lyase